MQQSTQTVHPQGTADAPRYYRVQHNDSGATPLWFIVCDEGWRQSIVAERMYDWTADWLLGVIGNRPFAPDHRP